MKFFQKPITLLSWTEPRDYVRFKYNQSRKHRPWWAFIGIWLALAVMGFSRISINIELAQIKTQIPGKEATVLPHNFLEPLPALLCGTLIITWLMFLAERFDQGRKIRMTENGIGSQKRFHKYDQIASAEWIDCETFCVLRLLLAESGSWLAGVPSTAERANIQVLLKTHGIDSINVNESVESVLTGHRQRLYKGIIGLFLMMALWMGGLGVSANFMLTDFKELKRYSDTSLENIQKVIRQMKDAGLSPSQLKEYDKTNMALALSNYNRLTKAYVVSGLLWTLFCFTAFYIVFSKVLAQKSGQISKPVALAADG